MNWSVRSVRKIVGPCDDHCEHLKEGDTAYIIHEERDSFGTVCAYAECAACAEQRHNDEQEKQVVCCDCKQRFRVADTREWCWYDFYAPQGDEALVLCHTCWKAPKHVARMLKDEEDRLYEAGYRNPVEDEDDYDDYDIADYQGPDGSDVTGS